MRRQNTILWVVLAVIICSGTVLAEDTLPSEELLEMSLEDLMNIPVPTTSLTPVSSNRFSPSTVTVITREDIQNSGARSLMELLEVYVPNFQWIFHGAKPRHMGLRGVIGKDDKYLLLVNGREMNEKTDFGVFSERDLPMLRDIQRVEVVRGPGSALYGPGALSMVINLIIDTPKTFQGSEVSLRTGIIEEHYTAEYKWGKMFNDNEGLLLYGGASIYPGADQSDSPLRFYTGNGALRGGIYYHVNDYYAGSRMRNYNQSAPGFPRMKFHAHYLNGDLNVWLRYTQGSEYVDQSESTWEGKWRRRDIMYFEGYRQATIAADYKHELTDNFTLNYHASYDRTNIETGPYLMSREMMYREDKYRARILANWNINDSHQAAFGAEVRHEEFGLEPDGRDETWNYVMSGGPNSTPRKMPRWSTDMYSLVGEYQWSITDQLKAFLGIRQDDHSFTEQMLSPRASIVYAMDEKNTFKLMLTKSSRTNVAEEMKRDDLGGNSDSDYETLKATEFKYERQHDKNLWFAVSYFMHEHALVSYYGGRSRAVANIESYGIEFEATYKKDPLDIRCSHAFTQLTHVRLGEGVAASGSTRAIEETVSGEGYGHNFANWANHQSKLNINYKLDKKWTWTNSLIVYWGYPGAEDYAELYNKWSPARYDLNGDEAFKASCFWNMGLEFEYSKNLTFRADAYNIMGWFDRDLNKRRFGFTNDFPAATRIQPAAFGLQMIYKF